MENFEVEKDFYLKVPLLEMSQAQWEAVCDGCGLCCFRKFIDGRGKNTKLFYTTIACDGLDLESGRCCNYKNRFKFYKECTHLTKKNVADFKWLPETCAYRLLAEGKALPEWHPLVCGKSLAENTDARAKLMFKNAIHEKDVVDWEDFVVKVEDFYE